MRFVLRHRRPAPANALCLVHDAADEGIGLAFRHRRVVGIGRGVALDLVLGHRVEPARRLLAEAGLLGA
ncbi:MAG: hypothetical protein ABW003_08695 [Microvirga sp.]